MTPLQTMTDFPVFSDNGTKLQPSEAKYAAGFANADVLPYEWVNWLFNKSSSAITTLNGGMTSVQNELISVLNAAGITPSAATNNQILSAIQYLIQSKTGILANLSTTDKTTLVAAINEIKASLGTAAGKTAGTAAGNVPLIDTDLTENAGTFVTTTEEGKIKNSGVPAGTAAGKNVDTTASTTSTNLPTTGMAISSGNAGAICSTAKGTQAKTISLTGFALYPGVTVKVMFTNGNSAANPTLNVTDTGAKAIKVVKAGAKVVPVNHTGYWRGASSTSTEMWQPYTILEFMYDGTDWVIVGNPTVESYYSSTSSYEVKADGLIEQSLQVLNEGRTSTITESNDIKFPVIFSNVNTIVPSYGGRARLDTNGGGYETCQQCNRLTTAGCRGYYTWSNGQSREGWQTTFATFTGY